MRGVVYNRAWYTIGYGWICDLAITTCVYDITDLTNGSAQLITCSEYFYHDPPSGLCKPTCSVRTTGTLSTFRGLYMFGIVGYVIAFIAACFNHKVM